MDINTIVDGPFERLPRGDERDPALSTDGSGWWSYADLRQRRNRYAHVLQQAGVRHGDRVGVVLLNSPDYVALYFAIVRIGAIAVRLNFRLAAAELSFLVQDSGCEVLFFHSSRTEQLGPVREQLPLRHWFCLADDDTPVPPWAEEPQLQAASTADVSSSRPHGTDPAMIMYTSGTTGRPKGAVWTHENALWFAAIQIMQWDFTSRTVAMTTGPLYHAGAFECFILPALLVHGRAVIMSSGGMSAQRIASAVGSARVTHALLYPFLIYDLLRMNESGREQLTSLQLILSGGDPLAEWAVEALREQLPGTVLNKGYGLTEGGAQSAVLEDDDIGTHPESVGRPLPLTRIRVTDVDGFEIDDGEIGDVWVHSPAISGYYWNRPQASAETFVDGWCRTGDLGHVTEDGFLVLSGRGKDMIRSGGENIYPAEIEGVLATHPGVATVAVVAVPDEKYLEVGCAVVVPTSESETTDELERALRELALRQLAKYKIPKYFEFVRRLPVSQAGKILKRELRDHFAELGRQARPQAPNQQGTQGEAQA